MPDGEQQQRDFRIDDGGPSYPYEKMRQAGRGRPQMRKVSGKAGRIPPQATDVEQSVLGAMLIEREAIPQVIEILPPEAFYERRHGRVYQAIRALFDRSNPVDLITLTEELKRRDELDDVGGSYYLTELTTAVASAANVEHHARIIAEKSLLRKMIESLTSLVGDAYEPGADAFDLLDQAEEEIFGISDSQLRSSSSSISDVVKDTVEKLQDIHGQEGGITGVPSGFGRLDDLTSGWQDADLIIVAARPSMGKCLGKGTPVMMYDGTTKPVEKIEVGDRLMGDDSEPRIVQSLARGRERMYWVRQTYGMDYRVNESHILSLKKSRREGAEPRGAVTDLSVREYFSKSDKWRDDHKGFKVAVDFPDRPLPLDPYVLGLWLGGEKMRKKEGEKMGAATATPMVVGDEPSNLPTFQPSRAQPRSGEHVPEHIPQRYLANSRANRLKLLAGLIDSDGHLNAGYGGTYSIIQTNRRLAEQIKFLCDTLGYRTSLKEKTVRITSLGYETTAHRVRFNGDVDEIPVRMERKQATPWTDGRDGRVSGVTVEPDGVGDYYGFTLDGNGRFLLADGTVTHNTAFCLASAMNAALHPRNETGVAIFSLEMGAEQLAQRLLTSEARVDAQKARTGRMDDEDWRRLARAAGTLSGAEIFIDDTPGLSILELRAKCRRLKAEHDIGLVVVDYLQLMHGTAQANNREQEIAQISRSLKALAKELDLPVIALSQLNRGVENRGGDKRPQLSDLRESGCLTGDTKILLAESGRRVPIRNLAGYSGFDVWAVNDETYRLERAEVRNAFSTGVKPVYRLQTQLGREIRATGNHKFLTVGGWKRLDEIAPGERIALPRALTPAGDATRTDDELALLGHLIGDGCTLANHVIQYTTQEKDLAECVADLARTVFGSDVAPRVQAERSWYQVYLTSTRHHTHGTGSAVSEWLRELDAWDRRAHEKQVPEAVFQQPAAGIARFLRHLWAADGCIQMRGGKKPYPAVYYASSSRQLATDVQSLLLRLGINARLKRVPQGEKGREQFHVIVSGKPDLGRFAETVRAAGDYKKAALRDVRAFLSERAGNTNRDVIPKAVWRSEVVPAMQEAGLTTRQMQAGLGMSYCGTTLYKSNLSRRRASRVAEVVSSDVLAHLAESDVYWDQVQAVEPDGREEVFDLTVPGLRNFVANDIFAHNSIEQDADVVSFIYRAERYGITVDAEGNSTEGIAEIIVGKQRNGPVGTVELAFVKQYARFENLSSHYGGGYGAQEYGDSSPAGGDGDVSAEDFQEATPGDGGDDFSAPRPSGNAPF